MVSLELDYPTVLGSCFVQLHRTDKWNSAQQLNGTDIFTLCQINRWVSFSRMIIKMEPLRWMGCLSRGEMSGMLRKSSPFVHICSGLLFARNLVHCSFQFMADNSTNIFVDHGHRTSNPSRNLLLTYVMHVQQYKLSVLYPIKIIFDIDHCVNF